MKANTKTTIRKPFGGISKANRNRANFGIGIKKLASDNEQSGIGIKKTPKRKSKNPLEKDIQKTIVSYLELNDIHVSVTNSERVWGKFGGVRASKVSPDHPDLTCVLPVLVNKRLLGLAFYIEVKTATGSIRDGQKVKLRALADSGALCILARGLEDVEPIVKQFKNAELDYEAIQKLRTLLELNLSDRRSKEVRDALAELKDTL